jgi:[ribosomal protein S5]-alanine N-acetyltransferase
LTSSAPEALTQPLRGERVLLRAFRPADVTEAHVAWLNDPALMRYSNQRFLRHDRESSLRYLASFEGSDNLYLSVRLADDDRPVGTLTAYRARHHGTADMGILIGDASVRGQGVGQDAWNTLAQWLLGPGRTRKLTCGTLACNRGMVRIAERSGMALEGVRKAQELVDGAAQDILYFARFHGA